MNNDFNSNTRTLIVSFVFALMVMVPLRFVEVGNVVSAPVVLGDSTEVVVTKVEKDCLDNAFVDKVISYLTDESEIAKFESRRCR